MHNILPKGHPGAAWYDLCTKYFSKCLSDAIDFNKIAEPVKKLALWKDRASLVPVSDFWMIWLGSQAV